MSNPINKAAQSFKYLTDGSFHGSDKRLIDNQLKDVAPSVEKIAAQAGVPLGSNTMDELSNQLPRTLKDAQHEDVGRLNDPSLSREQKAQLIAGSTRIANKAELDSHLRQLVNTTMRHHELNFSWLPEPVTVAQAYEKLGVDNPKAFLRKITEGDPAAVAMGFRPEDRSFYNRQLGEAQAEAATTVALAIVDSRVGAASVGLGISTPISALLAQQNAGSRFELEMATQQPGHEPATNSVQEKNALARAEQRQKEVVKEFASDLQALGTPTAQLVNEGLQWGLYQRTVAAENAKFVKAFGEQPDAQKLDFLKTYIKRRYQGSNAARTSALDSTDILRFVERSLSSAERREFINFFRARGKD